MIGGRDVLSRTGIFDDPITGYNASPRRVTSTNVLVGGDVGAGKSSFTKTVYALRPVILRGRRAVIFDKKSEFNPDLGLWEGEYSSLFGFSPHKNSKMWASLGIRSAAPLTVQG